MLHAALATTAAGLIGGAIAAATFAALIARAGRTRFHGVD